MILPMPADRPPHTPEEPKHLPHLPRDLLRLDLDRLVPSPSGSDRRFGEETGSSSVALWQTVGGVGSDDLKSGPRGSIATLATYMGSSAATFGFFMSIGSVSSRCAPHRRITVSLISGHQNRLRSESSDGSSRSRSRSAVSIIFLCKIQDVVCCR
jgi:hypothetical protein